MKSLAYQPQIRCNPTISAPIQGFGSSIPVISAPAFHSPGIPVRGRFGVFLGPQTQGFILGILTGDVLPQTGGRADLGPSCPCTPSLLLLLFPNGKSAPIPALFPVLVRIPVNQRKINPPEKLKQELNGKRRSQGAGNGSHSPIPFPRP